MSEQISKTYNKISDVFSRTQIKAAVEGLSTYRQRIQLIDHIIDRRTEIEKSEDIAKMQQYAHIFKRMLGKFRKKKNDQETEQKQQKIEMVMHLFRGEKKKIIQNPLQESRRLLKYCIMRDQSQPVTCQSIATQSTKADEVKINNNNDMPKLRKFERFFTEKNPQQVEYEMEKEIYDFLQKNKNLDNLEKERFLKITDDNQKFRYIENKIKFQLKQQEQQQYQMSVKKQYTVQNFFHKNYYKGNQIKILKQVKTKAPKLRECITNRPQLSNEESFSSYTEIKLNQLYQNSMDVQKQLKSKHSSCKIASCKEYLISNNKDIINISNQKLFHIKQLRK